jgi:hypothetical protein
MLTGTAACWLMLVGGQRPAQGHAPSKTPEARAVAFLAREVPRWSQENRCYSCHHNGDAARALYRAAGEGFEVPGQALADTTAWLSRPAQWDHRGGDAPVSDPRLARLVFTTAVAAAVEAGAVKDRSPLLRAAERLAQDQAEDGSWPLEGDDALGTPAAYAPSLATFLASDSLRAADPIRFRAAIDRAAGWLSRRELVSVTDAAAGLLAVAAADSATAVARRRRALDLLGRAQAVDGGWGPYLNSPPEPFDTAIALLALVKCPKTEEVRRMVMQGRKFLIAQQHNDGGWLETTRPAGGQSYAQRISTSGWATLALLASRDPR